MTTKSRTPSRRTTEFLEELAGCPLTFGRLLASIREGEDMSHVNFAKMLGVSRSHLCDIEKERKSVGPARAARFAKRLGYPPETFVRLALQGQVEEAGLKLNVKVDAA
jgi:plasmid maintenance system antidote protein VapI